VVPLLGSAHVAVMEDIILAVFFPQADWFHKSMALVSAVAGIIIHVLAPQALGTMISIAVAFNLKAAVFADEVFNCPLELLH
jgi:hypothetical protein